MKGKSNLISVLSGGNFPLMTNEEFESKIAGFAAPNNKPVIINANTIVWPVYRAVGYKIVHPNKEQRIGLFRIPMRTKRAHTTDWDRVYIFLPTEVDEFGPLYYISFEESIEEDSIVFEGFIVEIHNIRNLSA
jgi:hypothetical protein